MANVTIIPRDINNRPFKVGDLVVNKGSGRVFLLTSNGAVTGSFDWIRFGTPICAERNGLFPRESYDLFHGTVTLEN